MKSIILFGFFLVFIKHYFFLFLCLVVMKTQTTTVSDKVKNRLEQLDDFEEVCIM